MGFRSVASTSYGEAHLWNRSLGFQKVVSVPILYSHSCVYIYLCNEFFLCVFLV